MRFRVPGQLREFEIPDDWWIRAGMRGFLPSRHYFSYEAEPDRPPTIIVPFSDVEPPTRHPDVPLLFEERTISILSAFRDGVQLPPLWVVEMPSCPGKYRVHHGCHRYYCSAAVGFSHLPVFAEKPLDLEGEF
jgi:hypothetical protein